MGWWKKSKGEEVVEEAEEITRQAAKDRKDKDDGKEGGK